MKINRWLAIILSMLLVLFFTATALAEEGGGEFQEPPPQDGGGIGPSGDDPVDPPDPGGEEPDPPPVEDPTPPPSEDPTSPPDDNPTLPPDENPTPPPVDDPDSSDPPDGEVPDGPVEPSGDDPVTPSPEPYNPGALGGTTGGGSSSSAPPRNPAGQDTIRQPSLSPGVRSTPKPVSSDQQEDSGDLEPNYITFARLSQKNNSMSIVLFYSGASCVAVGLLGLLTLAIFIIRGRRLDQREGIFEEIEQAETRHPTGAASRRRAVQRTAHQSPPEPPQPQYEPEPDSSSYQPYNPGYQDAKQPLHHPEPEELAVPVNGALYTEEFEIPAQAYRQAAPRQQEPSRSAPPPSAASLYTEEFELPAQHPAPPPQASMYTEEFSIPEPRQNPARAPAPQPRRSSQSPNNSDYDTNELLRELLDGGNNRR